MLYQRHGCDIHALSTGPDWAANWRRTMPRAMSSPFSLRRLRQAGAGTTPNPRWFKIGQLTDVSFCKLQQYF
jgi:hypothetical protein